MEITNTDRKKELERKIAELQQRGAGTNPALISELLALKNELAELKTGINPKEIAKEAVKKSEEIVQPGDLMLDVQRKTKLDLQKNVEAAAPGIAAQVAAEKAARPVQGPATLAETQAAAPYERIGKSGFFAPPAPPKAEEGAKAVSKVLGPEAGKAVKDEVEKGSLYPPPDQPPNPPGAPDGAPGGVDFGAIAKKLGIGVMELVNAFAMGQAGITDPTKLAAGQRAAREDQAAQLKASQDQAKAELDYQINKDKLDQDFQTAQQNIQNDFIVTRDTEAARVAKAEADAKYQHDLGLIRAELDMAQKKAAEASRGDMAEVYQRALQTLAGKQGAAAAAEKTGAK
jgi:uncharacterized lipoprotein YehR (DUF1307 family)